MKSVPTAIIVAAIVLVVVLAVLVRLQQPEEIGSTRSGETYRRTRQADTRDQPGHDRTGGSERVRERLRQLRENDTARRRHEDVMEARREGDVVVGGRMSSERRLAIQAARKEAEEKKDSDEIREMQNTMLHDPDPDERAAAVFFLSISDEENALDLVMEAMDDPDPEVRLSVVEAMEEFEDDLTVDILNPALGDEDADVRFEAVSLLGELETPEATEAVRGMLDDPDEDVRALAKGILDLDD